MFPAQSLPFSALVSFVAGSNRRCHLVAVIDASLGLLVDQKPSLDREMELFDKLVALGIHFEVLAAASSLAVVAFDRHFAGTFCSGSSCSSCVVVVVVTLGFERAGFEEIALLVELVDW